MLYRLNKLYKLLIFASILFFFFRVDAQNIYSEYQKVLKTNNNVISNHVVDSLMALSLSQKDLYSYREIAHRYSIFLARKRKFSEALVYVLLEVKNFEENKVISKKYTNALYVAGRHYSDNFEYDQAIEYYNKVIDENNIKIRTGQAYAEIAANYNFMGNLIKAIEYYNKGLEIFKEEKDYNKLASHSIGKILTLYTLEEDHHLDAAYRVLKELDYIVKTEEIKESITLAVSNTYAMYYSLESRLDFDEALKYFRANLKRGLSINDTTTIVVANNNLANIFNLFKNDSSAFYVKQGLRYANYPEIKARLYDNLTEYQIRENELDNALKSIHKSLEIITKTDIDKLPSNYQISQSILLNYVLYCFKKKAEIFLKLNLRDNNRDYLKDVLMNIERSEYCLSLLLNRTSESSTQMIWRREASQAYLYASYASHLLEDPNLAFSFMEKNKALLLSESVLKNTEFANLPRHVAEQETAFQKQIYELENKSSQNEGDVVLQDSLFVAKQTHERYVDSLKTVYPKYFARKIEVDQISLDEVQQELGDEGAVLSYIWNDFDRDTELIIGLVATEDKAQTFEIRNVKELREKLNLYREFISQPFRTQEDRDSFQKVAYELYTLLLPNEEVRDLVRGKNLTIIPDGDLQNMPFESLITKKASNEYLILNGDVHYSYSYSFLKHNEKVNRNAKQTFIGYSPSSFEEHSLSSIKNSKEEVLNINDQFEGIAKLQDTATKEDFLKNSSNAKIIHLATHADVGKNPWIAFSDEKLELHELYTYKNNADLVTLSGCNTSLGELARGEGVLSLARGFFYSGSKSVVSSLWKVNDKSTSEIMTNFYKNLKSGQTKSEALNKAKRSYLTSHSLSEQSPYYWSSFILIGDAGNIDLPSNHLVYLIIGLLAVAVILIFRKKFKFFG